MEISLYGGNGFIGNTFYYRQMTLPDLFCDNIHKIARYSRRPIFNITPGKYDGQILYLISTTHNYNVLEDATIDVDTNLTVLTETLDSWRHNHPMATFNFVSSWFVYGDNGYDGDIECHEWAPCNPKGFYSITKRCAEQLVISYCETFNLKYRILRLANVVGRSDNNVSAKKNALQYLLNKMNAGEDIDVYEKGEFFRNYINVNDCSDAIRLVMEKGEKNAIYNIGSSNCLFISMLVYAAMKMDYKGKFNFIEQKSFHKTVQTKSFAMNTNKLKELGFVPYYDTGEKIIDSLL
jgi:nucleoside-diphosphate-sugar epimerase